MIFTILCEYHTLLLVLVLVLLLLLPGPSDNSINRQKWYLSKQHP